jgi:phosphatidate cytidylyltransferase
MLRQRIITALVLLAVLLPAVFSALTWPFAALSLLMIGAAGWEWARLNGLPQTPALGMGCLLALAGLVAWWLGWVARAPVALWPIAAGLWVAGGAYTLYGGVQRWPQWPHLARLLGGLLALCLAWLAMMAAKSLGLNFLLSVLCLVWMADVAAYFGGRQFGRRKLAPSISPGKSWAGVYSGVVGVLLLAGFWIWLDSQFQVDSQSIFSAVFRSAGPLGLALAVLLLCAMSVVGDLVESLVKRCAGAKDSSQLLPGHGGVLDRIDALIPVFPLALAIYQLFV